MNSEFLIYAKDPSLSLHLDAVDFYMNRLKGNPIFRSAVIVGSFAKGCPDRLSDIDLITFVEDNTATEAYRYLVKEEPFPVVHAFEANHESRFFCKKYIFDNYVSAEIHVCAKSNSFKLKNPFIELFDHDNFLKYIVEEGEPPKQEDFPALSLGEDGLAWELHDMVKWWTRGKNELVKSHIKKIAKKLEEIDGSTKAEY